MLRIPLAGTALSYCKKSIEDNQPMGTSGHTNDSPDDTHDASYNEAEKTSHVASESRYNIIATSNEITSGLHLIFKGGAWHLKRCNRQAWIFFTR
jgi:hypothetical protein